MEVVGAAIFAASPWATHGEVVMVQAPMLDLIVYSTQVFCIIHLGVTRHGFATAMAFYGVGQLECIPMVPQHRIYLFSICIKYL